VSVKWRFVARCLDFVSRDLKSNCSGGSSWRVVCGCPRDCEWSEVGGSSTNARRSWRLAVRPAALREARASRCARPGWRRGARRLTAASIRSEPDNRL